MSHRNTSDTVPHLSAVNGGEMEHEGSGGSGGSAGLLQQILSLKLVPRVGNGTLCPNSTSLCSFPGIGPAPRLRSARPAATGPRWCAPSPSVQAGFRLAARWWLFSSRKEDLGPLAESWGF